MPPQIRKYDELGFPVPATFEDLAMPDRDLVSTSKPTAKTMGPRGASRGKRIVLGGILLGIVALAAVPWLTDVGQGLLGDWLAQRARHKFNQGDMPGTVADSTRAFRFLGEDLNDERQIELLSIRGCAKLEINDLEGSRADFDRVLTSPKAHREIRTICYLHRSWVNCRLQNHEAAVADATAAIELAGLNQRFLAILLNQRAYIRALANQSKQELDAGLEDIDRAMRMTGDNPAFIDTRGYLLHLLGSHDDALREMNRAIELTLAVKQRVYRIEDAQRLAEDLAVMHHHRGLIYHALGLKDKAIEDLQLADDYGYDPASGVL